MNPSMTRREALITAGRVLAGAAVARGFPWHLGVGTREPHFERSFRMPPVLRPVRSDEATDYYEIAQQIGVTEIRGGTRTTIWGFEGIAPGPTIHARRGRGVVVRQTNHLDVPTVVHLHGGATPPESDGFPIDVIVPGQSREYIYPNDQPAATLWYHDHTIHDAGRNVYMGLAGLYLIHDDEEDDLRLPDGAFDVPLLIQERSLDAGGELHYSRALNLGATGDLVLVNGIPWPRMTVSARRYRFRVVNGTNSSVYRLALNSGRPLVQIGTDGGLLEAPVESASISLAMSERAEMVIDFSTYQIGSRVVLTNLMADGPRGDVMCFDVVGAERDTSQLPDRLGSIERLSPDTATQTREFVFSGGPSSFPPTSHWTINGQDFDPDHPIASPRLGDVEIWHIRNRRRFGILGMVHPVHVHLVHFQILERNGVAPYPYEMGWKDTVAVAPGEDVRIIARFDGHKGRYLIHCHNLEHEDHHMMARYDVI